MASRNISLDDRYGFEGKPYYLNGTQSLVRLMQLEKRRRAAQGRKTAVYVTGYRGSPLGAFDQAMARAAKVLGPDIVLRPEVNEDIAATAVWGTQQLGAFAEGRVEGVSAAWYGKGPGVDRSGDAFKHGNLAGAAREGGVLVIAGDDHTCKSSTTAHQSEYALVDAMIPVLAPASIVEQMEYGLVGWELSRFAGLWTALKVVTEIMDSSESVLADPVVDLAHPPDFPLPEGGLSLRWPDTPLAQEERLHRFKIPAALAFARANRLDRVVFGRSRARLGIVTVGKALADTRQALADLGLDEARAVELGLALYKVAMPWPLEPEGLRAFARTVDRIVVVEEKRGLVEEQVRAHLYGMTSAPVVVGKRDADGAWLFPSNGDLGADRIATGLGGEILAATGDAQVRARLQDIAGRLETAARLEVLAQRPPHFCPGCPHNLSTKVPEGSRAFAGIGCHYLVQPMERETAGFTQMGGEGANWIGLAPFADTTHMFQNIGDGTYFHSGSLAIRAAIAAGVNITYKILFNDAVAMTGGQALDGELTVQRLAAQVAAEGARRIVVVSDDPARHRHGDFPPGILLRPREELDQVQRELREVQGVSVLIYEQTCATELRRLRKRGQAKDPELAVVVNDLVCEGCGDCSQASNCLAVVPVDTEFGRKRAVDLSACNKDQSCLQGFCPSFVTVEGGRLRRPVAAQADSTGLPEPQSALASDDLSLIVAGVGGTGVVTIGAILGMAAHIDGKAVRVMDMTGLAQKGGAVVSHVQISATPSRLAAAKVSGGSADLLLACDLVVGAAPDNVGRVSRATGHVIANEHETTTGLFTRQPDHALPVGALKAALAAAVGPGRAAFCDATELARRLVGDAVGANLFLVGFAWQRGLLPISLAALDQAIALNGVAVALNRQAFDWGRRAAIDLAAVQAAASPGRPEHHRLSASLDEGLDRREAFLADYQDAAYARRFREVVEAVRQAERRVAPEAEALTAAVGRSLFRLMAYKDEYEVARLHAETAFLASVAGQFEGRYRLAFHLAPPLLARRDPATGAPRKMRFGGWIVPLFRILAKARRIRGTLFDPFGYTSERRMERRLVEDYRKLILETVLPALTASNHEAAVAVAEAAQAVRGFGHVKLRTLKTAEALEAAALARFRSAAPVAPGPTFTVEQRRAAPAG
jgi:indolepyruvate ferredoxin oxidoreductase